MQEISKNLDLIIDILKKLPLSRTEQELSSLINATKQIPFFQKYIQEGKQNIHLQCCVQMQHEYQPALNQVFKINSKGNKFYIILKGKVGIYIKGNQQILPESQQPNENLTRLQNQLLLNNLFCVKELESGQQFGELALITNNPRLATVICHTPCHFATIDKVNFTKILKHDEKKKIIQQMGFFIYLPLFKEWSLQSIRALYLNCEFKLFNKHDYIFREQQEADAVYVIVDGEYLIVKNFKIQSNNAIIKELENDKIQNTNQFLNKNMSQKNIPQKEIKMRIIGPHEIFGEEDIMQNCNRTYSVICNSVSGTLLIVKKIYFFNYIMQDQTSAQYLKSTLQSKLIAFNEQVEQVNKSIFKYQPYFNKKSSEQSLLSTDEEQKQNKKNQMKQFIQKVRNNYGIVSPNILKKKLKMMKDPRYRSCAKLRPNIIKTEVEDQNFTQQVNVSKSDRKKKYESELTMSFHRALKFKYFQKFGDQQINQIKKHVPQEVVQSVDNDFTSEYRKEKLKKEKEHQLQQNRLEAILIKSNEIQRKTSIQKRLSTLIMQQSQDKSPLRLYSTESISPTFIREASKNGLKRIQNRNSLINQDNSQCELNKQSSLKTCPCIDECDITKNKSIVSQKALDQNQNSLMNQEKQDSFSKPKNQILIKQKLFLKNILQKHINQKIENNYNAVISHHTQKSTSSIQSNSYTNNTNARVTMRSISQETITSLNAECTSFRQADTLKTKEINAKDHTKQKYFFQNLKNKQVNFDQNQIPQQKLQLKSFSMTFINSNQVFKNILLKKRIMREQQFRQSQTINIEKQ